MRASRRLSPTLRGACRPDLRRGLWRPAGGDDERARSPRGRSSPLRSTSPCRRRSAHRRRCGCRPSPRARCRTGSSSSSWSSTSFRSWTSCSTCARVARPTPRARRARRRSPRACSRKAPRRAPSLQIADQAAYLGVRVGAGSGWEQSTVSLHAPTAQLDSALALFADVALHPAFTAADLERVRKVRLTALQQVRDRGPAIADRAYATALYGEQHPYGRPLAGTEASVADLTRDDLVKFYTTLLPPEQRHAARGGRRATGRHGASRNRHVRRLDARRRASGERKHRVGAPKATTLVLIDKPGAAQSSFRLGGIGVPRSDQRLLRDPGDEHDPRRVVHEPAQPEPARDARLHVRRAAPASRCAASAGPFTASAEVVSAKTDSAFIEFMKELRAIRDTVPSDELAKAKRYLQLGLPEDFETTGEHRVPDAPARHLRHSARLLQHGSAEDRRRDAGGRAARGQAVHRTPIG